MSSRIAASRGGRAWDSSRGILEVARAERVRVRADDVAEIVGVGAVREHVGDAELLAALGVRIARHHDDDLLAAEIVGARLAALDALDPARAVAERDELLQELRD